jgi:hypothetical protein
MCIASTYFNPAMRREDVFEFDASDRPLLLQLTDCVPEPIIELAKDARFVGCIDAIDLNLGCPQPFAMKRPVGAGLVCGAFSWFAPAQRWPQVEKHGIEWMASFAKKVVDNVAYPVTAKIRCCRARLRWAALTSNTGFIKIFQQQLRMQMHWFERALLRSPFMVVVGGRKALWELRVAVVCRAVSHCSRAGRMWLECDWRDQTSITSSYTCDW